MSPPGMYANGTSSISAVTELLGAVPWQVHPSLATSLGPPAADWSPPTPPGKEDTGVANNNNKNHQKRHYFLVYREHLYTL